LGVFINDVQFASQQQKKLAEVAVISLEQKSIQSL